MFGAILLKSMDRFIIVVLGTSARRYTWVPGKKAPSYYRTRHPAHKRCVPCVERLWKRVAGFDAHVGNQVKSMSWLVPYLTNSPDDGLKATLKCPNCRFWHHIGCLCATPLQRVSYVCPIFNCGQIFSTNRQLQGYFPKLIFSNLSDVRHRPSEIKTLV
jgi:hypothetical protein